MTQLRREVIWAGCRWMSNAEMWGKRIRCRTLVEGHIAEQLLVYPARCSKCFKNVGQLPPNSTAEMERGREMAKELGVRRTVRELDKIDGLAIGGAEDRKNQGHKNCRELEV